jgi:hypothetical protein
MATGHTAGPWRVEPAGGGDEFEVTADDGAILIAQPPSEADARVIAAAPALLAAIRGLEYDRQPGRYCDHSDYENCPRCAAVVAAIKLAEGG